MKTVSSKPLNDKAVLQLIRSGRNSRLCWHKVEGLELVTDSMFLIAQHELSIALRATLFEAFGRLAMPGDQLSSVFGTVNECGPDLVKIYKPGEATVKGTITPFVIDGKPNMRLIYFQNSSHAVVNECYIRMLSNPLGTSVWSTGNKGSVLYFGDEKQLMICPVFVEDVYRYYFNPAGLYESAYKQEA